MATSLEISFDHSLYVDEEEELKRKRKVLRNAIVQISDGRISPIQCTSRLSWSELGERRQGYFVRKAREVIETTLNCLAPGCEADLWSATMQSLPVDQSKQSDVMGNLAEAYNQAENRETRLQILSMFVNSFNLAKVNCRKLFQVFQSGKLMMPVHMLTYEGQGSISILQKSIERDLRKQKLITF